MTADRSQTSTCAIHVPSKCDIKSDCDLPPTLDVPVLVTNHSQPRYQGSTCDIPRMSHPWHDRPAHPLEMVKYGGVPQHQLKRFLGTCELTPLSPENWPQILGRLIYSASVLPGSTSIKRVIFRSFLREIRRLHSLVNHLETALRGASENPGPRPTCFQRPQWC